MAANGKDKVIYQIFPRSFKDSDNDGSGDFNGITQKMDHLQELGIDAIWLCPVYDTNFADAGYDVKDYLSVGDTFGTIEDFKKMSAAAQKKGIDIIMDIVLNHVSTEHEWFVKASRSTTCQEHNYFVGRETLSEDEKLAKSIFGGSAWEWVPAVKKYYFHLFAREQADLNWDHPATTKAMANVIDFWYKLGVRGFRYDAIKHIAKVFPDGTRNDFSGCPGVIEQLHRLNEVAFAGKPDTFVLGEASGITLDEMVKYGTGANKVVPNFYNFSGWAIGWGKETGRNGYDANWDWREFANAMAAFQSSESITPEMMTNFLTNHDTARAVSRGGDEGVFHRESSKTLAMLLFVMKGIPCICYGEEIGMLNPRFTSRGEFRDVDAINAFNILVDERKVYSEDEMTKYHNINSRDNARTPMAWDGSKNAGFCDNATPWIKIGFGSEAINVHAQRNDKDSVFSFFKQMIAMRKSHEYGKILVDGKSDVSIIDNGVIKVTRTHESGAKLTALINLRSLRIDVPNYSNRKQVLSSWIDNKKYANALRPYESILFID